MEVDFHVIRGLTPLEGCITNTMQFSSISKGHRSGDNMYGDDMKTLWLHRPLINWQDIFDWANETGVKKLMPPEQLHLTLATCREPVDWSDLVLKEDILEVEAGHKTVQIFGFMAKAIAFGHPAVKERHEELAALYPTMDHSAMLRPHVTLMRGGKMPKEPYLGKLVFGPEVAQEFNETAIREIKHVLAKDYAKVEE